MAEGDVEVVRKAFDAFARRDLDDLCALADSQIEFRPATGAIAGRHGPYRGHEGVRQYFDDVAEVWRQLRITPQDFVETDAGVLVLGRVWSQDKRNVVRDFPAAWLWEVEGGLVRSWRVYSDTGAAEPQQRARRWRRGRGRE